MKQVFADGRQRIRGSYLTEKMLPNDSLAIDAARRGIVRELGEFVPCADKVVALAAPSGDAGGTRTVCDESHSYPSLPCTYTIHTVEALIRGLPAEGFHTCLYSDAQRTLLELTAFWEWRHVKGNPQGKGAGGQLLFSDGT